MRPQKIIFGEMHAGGPTAILVSIAPSADQWADDVALSDIEPRFVCKACGKRGADVRRILRRREWEHRRDVSAERSKQGDLRATVYCQLCSR